MHTFHIPVMGLAFTIDSPIRVAQCGIDSVISIMDDDLTEKMRAYYSEKFKQPYEEISKKVEDFRAKRITNYLNLVDKIVNEKFENFKKELLQTKTSLDSFISILPNESQLKHRLTELITTSKDNFNEIKIVLEQFFYPGSIDVNIMTKVDKDNFANNEQLPVIFNDAHAALRGFANSTTKSAVVFSAGMNPRLYSYLETFDNFYPDANGNFQKKIILKVSDFRSAMIQGNFLAKKGLWVSEYRIESGLNCGGHAFATDGLLVGPILEEFNAKREELITSAFSLLEKALSSKNKEVPLVPPTLKITYQGGVGTSEEHQFLITQYGIDAVGWGSPFLLVPEATSVDDETRKLIAKSTEEDFYLSNISPLGVPFNTIKGMTNDFYKNQRISSGKAGSSCPKKYLALTKEYDKEGSCTASKKYQDKKIQELLNKQEELTDDAFSKEMKKITEKACLCVGLSNASQLELSIPIKGQAQGVVVCPGPNIAYFNQEVSLSDMIQHIYGYKNIEIQENRPNVFIKELQLYIDYFKNQIDEIIDMQSAQTKKWETFKNNLIHGIDYYKNLFEQNLFKNKQDILHQLEEYKNQLLAIEINKYDYGEASI